MCLKSYDLSMQLIALFDLHEPFVNNPKVPCEGLETHRGKRGSWQTDNQLTW